MFSLTLILDFPWLRIFCVLPFLDLGLDIMPATINSPFYPLHSVVVFQSFPHSPHRFLTHAASCIKLNSVLTKEANHMMHENQINNLSAVHLNIVLLIGISSMCVQAIIISLIVYPCIACDPREKWTKPTSLQTGYSVPGAAVCSPFGCHISPVCPL